MKNQPTSSTVGFKSQLSKYFGAHGRFCASHPWEVIVSIVTLTVCALSMSVISGGKVSTVCGFSKPCQPKPVDEERSDTVMLSIVNSLAVIYIYKQFSSLRKAGSKYLLGIAGLFTIFSSFVFGSTVVNIIDSKVSGLNEALPFFLLLIDLSKASALAKMAFKSRSKEEVRENIGRGIAALGPTMTLDTMVEVLLISIGTISGVPRFETMCCFGCMSIIASYLVFMTFFPASLALVLEVCPHDPSNYGWHLDNLARDMQEEETKKSNPVAQRVKIIMSLGLAVVHLHSRFLSSVTGWLFGFEWGAGSKEGADTGDTSLSGEMELVPLPQYLWWKAFNLTVDQMIAIALSTLLFIKYIFFDKSDTFSTTSVPPTPNSASPKKTPPKAPPPSQNSAAENTTSEAMCPFALLEPSESHLAARRNPELPPAAAAVGGAQSLPDMEKMVAEGIVLSTGSPGKERKALLPPSDSGSQGSLGGLARNRSSGSLLQSVSEPSVDLALNPVSSVTVGTQTEGLDRETPKFTVGGDKEEAEASCADSKPPKTPLDLPPVPRQLDECVAILKSDDGANLLTDLEVIKLVEFKHIPAYKLEAVLGSFERGVSIRRQILAKKLSGGGDLSNLPYTSYPHYSVVNGACCENVIGYMPIPVGYAGPLLLDGTPYHVPMSTTEGALVASTNRGCRAVASAGGVQSSILDDGMTRGPVVRLPSATQASQVKVWLDDKNNFQLVEEVFNSTSRFARLKRLQTSVAGRLLYIRFKASTGDAMGMNMLSKGVEKSLEFLKEKFPLLEVISLSGNFCTDKKPAAINWVEGRGKSVVCEAIIPAHIVTKVLKTSVDALVELNISKNLVGSAMAGSIGGFNAHAANIVTAIFIATGQDPAQNVASSNCMTLMERGGPKGEDLHISCTMPSIEIGTVGGGTILPPQAACLKMLGVQGPNQDSPGENASLLARIVCGTVLAGELSLLSALAAGHLVKSHLTHNRSQLNLGSIPESSEPRGDHRRTHSDTMASPPPMVKAGHGSRRRASAAPS